MLKAFVDHIQKTAQPMITAVNGTNFVIRSDGTAEELLPEPVHPDTLPLHSLDALVKLVKSEAMKYAAPLYITVPDHLTVRCFAQPQAEQRFFRQVWYEVHATDVPGWDENVQLGFEEAQIALRTRFQETEDTVYAMKLLSDITCGAKVTYNDNGVATTVMTQKGVALQSSAQIRPLITLRPYRTFQEVSQPGSLFLIRLSERGIRFVEADGGMWKLDARETVKCFLAQALADEIDDGAVFVAL